MTRNSERCCWEETCHSVSIAYWKLAPQDESPITRIQSQRDGPEPSPWIGFFCSPSSTIVHRWYAPRHETDAQTPRISFFTNRPYFCLAAQLPHARGSPPLGRAPLQLNLIKLLPRGALSPNGPRSAYLMAGKESSDWD